MDDRGRPDRPHSSQGLDRVADQRVVAEPVQELAVVVVRREDETELRERLVGLGALDRGVELSVRLLNDAGQSRPVTDLIGNCQDAVAEKARRVALHPGRESERVGLDRRDRGLERHGPSLTARSVRVARGGTTRLRSRQRS